MATVKSARPENFRVLKLGCRGFGADMRSFGMEFSASNQYNAKFVYVGNAILSYLHNHEEDFGITNPFDPSNTVFNGLCGAITFA